MKNKVLSLLTASLLFTSVIAQQAYEPTQENLKTRKEFQDDKFGIFIHYGIYSMLGDGEWVLHTWNLKHKEYAKLAGGFCPSKFNAAEWVAAIKASGAKYICFTTRHHDGFSMFDSQYSNYNIVKSTPFNRDIVKELTDECHKQNIKVHFYYSHLDWGRDDYPLGRTGRNTGRKLQENWDSYYRFMNNQLTELLTHYGPVRAIWFDGWWDQDQKSGFDWHLPQQYEMIHKLQPACLIGNNHHQLPYPGEDIQIFERDLPGENTFGLSGQAIGHLPLETFETMNTSWGYKITDNNYKSTEALIRLLVKAAGKDANLLLNIGPQPDGCIPDTSIERLKNIGKWLEKNGETIYGTRGGVVPPRDWGVTTQKDNKIYVHILDWKDKGLFLPITDIKIKKACLFKNKENISFSQNKQGLFLQLPEVPTGVDYIVELQR